MTLSQASASPMMSQSDFSCASWLTGLTVQVLRSTSQYSAVFTARPSTSTATKVSDACLPHFSAMPGDAAASPRRSCSPSFPEPGRAAAAGALVAPTALASARRSAGGAVVPQESSAGR